MSKVELTIPGPIPSKKNSKQIITVRGRPIIISSKKYLAWNKMARGSVRIQTVWHKLQRVEDIRLITIKFYWPDKRRRDLSNIAEGVMDLLVETKIIQDDCWKFVPKLVLISSGIDKVKPRAEVEIDDQSDNN